MPWGDIAALLPVLHLEVSFWENSNKYGKPVPRQLTLKATAFYKPGFLLVPERQSKKGKWNNVLWSCGSVCHYTGELVLSQWKKPNQPYIGPRRNKRNLSKSNSSPFILSLQKDVIKDTCTIALAKASLYWRVPEKEAQLVHHPPDKDFWGLDCAFQV